VTKLSKFKFFSYLSACTFCYIGFVIIYESSDHLQDTGNDYQIPIFRPNLDYPKHFLIALFLYNNSTTAISVFYSEKRKEAAYLSLVNFFFFFI
jgi:hypothetical protein